MNNIVASCQKHKIWYTSEGWGLKTAVVYWSSGARAWNPHISRECFHLWTGFCLFCQYREVKTCLQDFDFSCRRQHQHVHLQSESQLCCLSPLYASGVDLGVWGGFLQHWPVSAGYSSPPPDMMMCWIIRGITKRYLAFKRLLAFCYRPLTFTDPVNK